MGAHIRHCYMQYDIQTFRDLKHPFKFFPEVKMRKKLREVLETTIPICLAPIIGSLVALLLWIIWR